MLGRIGGLGGLFGPKTDHPLASNSEMQRIIEELPTDNAFKALDEVVGWLESLQMATDFPGERLFEATKQLDDVAQPHLRRLARDYLHAQRLPKNEEKRLWSINYGFWNLLAANYEKCLGFLGGKDKAAAVAKAQLPLLSVRFLRAVGALIKWEQFHYGPTTNPVWLRLGQAYRAVEHSGGAQKAVQIYPNSAGTTNATQEYLKVLVFQASSMDSLLPGEIELAERLIVHFLPGFVFGPERHPESICWVDLSQARPPQRLLRAPRELTPTLRYFRPADAFGQLLGLVADLERGGDVPPDINLGGQYHPRVVLPVLHHLANYWSPAPPKRKFDRHRVKHRLSVLHGLGNALVVFSGDSARPPTVPEMESWVVENVSRSGFGAVFADARVEWPKVGELLVMQPEGGENWLLGIVRRYHRANDQEARVGIEALARHATALELRPRTASSYGAAAGIPAVLIDDGNEPGEIRVVLPVATFDLRESLEFVRDGKRMLLSPVAVAEQTADYEIARYRLRVAT